MCSINKRADTALFILALVLWLFAPGDIDVSAHPHDPSLVLGMSLELTGNVALSVTATARSGNDGLFSSGDGFGPLSAALLAASQDGTDPWVVAEGSFWMSARAGNLGIIYRITEATEARASQDVVSLFRALADRHDASSAELELGLYHRTLIADALELEMPVVQGSRLDIRLRGTLIAPRHMSMLSAVGHGVTTETAPPAFYLDFVNVDARNGVGWAVGGAARYQTERFSITASVSDLWGAITWPKARVRRGLANNQTMRTGPDGYPSFAPFIEGTYWEETWHARLSPRWEVAYEPATSTRLSGVSISGRQHMLRAISRWRLNADYVLTAGLSLPGHAIHLGLEWDSWSISVAAAGSSLPGTPVLRLAVQHQWL